MAKAISTTTAGGAIRTTYLPRRCPACGKLDPATKTSLNGADPLGPPLYLLSCLCGWAERYKLEPAGPATS